MKIEHLAIYTSDLEAMKLFYEKFFNAWVGEKYFNPKKNFTSYFLSFDSGSRLELMKRDDIPANANKSAEYQGLIHFAMSVGSKEKVNELTEEIRAAGHQVIGEPRTTGDGYYESVIMDPEGNRIEITA